MKYRVVNVPKDRHDASKGFYVRLQYRPWWWPFWSTRADGAYETLPIDYKTTDKAIEEIKRLENVVQDKVIVEAEYR